MTRRTVRYADEAAAVADVERLRRGWLAHGRWTLAEAAFHCGWPLQLPLAPATADAVSDRQRPFRDFLERVNAADAWPAPGMPAPSEMMPPADAGEADLDRYVAGLNKLAGCRIAVLENQAFGPLPLEAFRRFALIHAAHHFGFFEPTA